MRTGSKQFQGLLDSRYPSKDILITFSTVCSSSSTWGHERDLCGSQGSSISLPGRRSYLIQIQHWTSCSEVADRCSTNTQTKNAWGSETHSLQLIHGLWTVVNQETIFTQCIQMFTSLSYNHYNPPPHLVSLISLTALTLRHDTSVTCNRLQCQTAERKKKKKKKKGYCFCILHSGDMLEAEKQWKTL